MRPSPMGIGAVLKNSWTVFSRKFGLFLGLNLLPLLATFGAFLALGLLFALVMIPAMGRREWNTVDPTPLILSIIVLGLGTLVIYGGVALYQMRVQGQMALVAHETFHGRDITMGDSARRTPGMWGRLFMLLLIGVAAYVAVWIVFAVFGGILSSMGRGNSGGAGSIGLLMAALVIALYVAFIWVAVKLTYWMQAMAIENLGAMDSLKRSWSLTTGEFWRTFGYFLVIGLAAGLPIFVIYLVTMMPIIMSSTGSREPNGGAIAMAMVGYLLLMAYVFLLTPFMVSVTTVMYLDQRARKGEQGALPEYAGAYGAPQYGQQAYGQPYGTSQPVGAQPQTPPVTPGYGAPAYDTQPQQTWTPPVQDQWTPPTQGWTPPAQNPGQYPPPGSPQQ